MQRIEKVVSVYSKKTDQRRKIIGNISHTLAKLVYGLKVHQLISKNDGKHRGAPERTWASC